jgi:predicted N-formylglutamate amidohydrolase
VTWSRLLVESNRAPTNPRIWSRYTAGLPTEERARILERYWWPHRRDVQKAIRSVVASRCRAVHIAVHSFTPVLDGELRNADIGLLYDPRRSGEKALCTRWQKILEELDPKVRVRRNYPYSGVADGLTTWLRRRVSERNYVGVELEVNQALLASPRRDHVKRLIAQSIGNLLRG